METWICEMICDFPAQEANKGNMKNKIICSEYYLLMGEKGINVHSKRSRRIYCAQCTKSSFSVLSLVVLLFKTILFFFYFPPQIHSNKKKKF